MISTCVHSFSKALPKRLISNEELSKIIDTSDDWITQRTGIKQRFWVEEGQTTSDLAVLAAQQTLAQAGAGAVDCIIAATLSPDFNFPGIGVQLQAKLGLESVPAYDLRNQCAGFLYGLEMAEALIAAGKYKRILLVGAEVHSTGLDVSTRGRDIAVLFGDGAGSCIVEAKDQCVTAGKKYFEILGTELHSDGSFASELWCEHPGSAHFPTRLTPELVAEAKCFPTMNGRRVFEHAVKQMTQVAHSVLAKHGITPAAVDYFIPHQANARINQLVAETLGVRPEAVFSTIQKYGNTTAATIPIGYADACDQLSFTSGQYALSAAFGSGFVWGAALLRVL